MFFSLLVYSSTEPGVMRCFALSGYDLSGSMQACVNNALETMTPPHPDRETEGTEITLTSAHRAARRERERIWRGY